MISCRVSHGRMSFAPTLTNATFVPNSLPDTQTRSIEYGVCHGRRGRVASSTPMPGTITTSWRRTQEAVRNASMAIPKGTFRLFTASIVILGVP